MAGLRRGGFYYGLKVRHSGGRTVRMIPNGGDNGQKIRTRRDQRSAIRRRNTANRNTRYRCRFTPPGQNIGGRLNRRFLCGRPKECAECDVIGTCLRRVDREMTRCFAGHANNGFRAEQPTRFRVAGIVLADVNTVAAGLASEVRAIVHDKGDIPVLADGPQYIGRPAYCVFVDVLETQLNACRAARIQRGTELVGERRRVVETWRRDQIEFRKRVFGYRRATVRPCLCKC